MTAKETVKKKNKAFMVLPPMKKRKNATHSAKRSQSEESCTSEYDLIFYF